MCRKGYNRKGHIWPVPLTLYSWDPILFFSWYFLDGIFTRTCNEVSIIHSDDGTGCLPNLYEPHSHCLLCFRPKFQIIYLLIHIALFLTLSLYFLNLKQAIHSSLFKFDV